MIFGVGRNSKTSFLKAKVDTSKQLYFLHIKKAMGSSMRIYLERHFNVKEQTLPMNIPKLNQYTAEQLTRMKFVTGHYDIAYIEKSGANPNVITMLREPKDRMLSEYYYWNNPNDPDDDPRKIKNVAHMSLQGFVNDPRSSNIQTKSLSRGFFMPERFYASEQQLLSEAKKFLTEMMFFGIAEKVQESIDMLGYLMGWRPTVFDIRINSTKKRKRIDEIPTEVREALAKANELDLELYNWAKKLFRQRYNVFLSQLLGKNRATQIIDRPYDQVRKEIEPMLWKRYMRKTVKLKRTRELTYTFDMPLEGNHWLSSKGPYNWSEYPWRWTTANMADIDLPLQRDVPLELRFHVKQSFANKLDVYVDDSVPVTLTKVTSGIFGPIAGTLYIGVIEQNTCWKKKLTTIQFHCDQLQFHREEIPQDPDGRPLGIAVDWIQVVPLARR